MNCKNCGKPLAPDVKFCGFCGTVVENQKEDKRFKEKEKGINNTTKIAVLIMLLAFFILGVSVFIFVLKTQKPQVKDTVTTQTLSTKPVTTTLSQGIYQTDNTETESPNPPDPTQKNDSMNLVGTYWRLAYGPTNGVQYIARFEENGRLFALNIGSDTFSTGTYTYSQDKLYIEIDYHANYFKKISNDEFKVTEAIYIPNGNIKFHYRVSRVTEPASIKYFTEWEEKIPGNNTMKVTTESTYTEPQQNSYSNTQTNYDKYGKYFGEDKYFALNDYPNAEEQPNEFMGANFQLQVTNSVCLVYDWSQICGHYECLATDIYPNIALGKSSMTQEEFENYLGVSTKFTSKEVNSDPYLSDGEIDSATLHYDHKGYSIMVFCEDDGSIIFDKTVFWVNKSE